VNWRDPLPLPETLLLYGKITLKWVIRAGWGVWGCKMDRGMFQDFVNVRRNWPSSSMKGQSLYNLNDSQPFLCGINIWHSLPHTRISQQKCSLKSYRNKSQAIVHTSAWINSRYGLEKEDTFCHSSYASVQNMPLNRKTGGIGIKWKVRDFLVLIDHAILSKET
jgi:hypothetical protein